jgi:3-oxoacyl-(acyl-carrier-protein) synthase
MQTRGVRIYGATVKYQTAKWNYENSDPDRFFVYLYMPRAPVFHEY